MAACANGSRTAQCSICCRTNQNIRLVWMFYTSCGQMMVALLERQYQVMTREASKVSMSKASTAIAMDVFSRSAALSKGRFCAAATSARNGANGAINFATEIKHSYNVS